MLALAAAMDMGGNTPIEFLLEHSGIELLTLYVVDGVELPAPLPDHDVAIVIASELRRVPRGAAQDRPGRHRAGRGRCSIRRSLVGNLDRDKLHRLLYGIEGLDIPATEAVTPRAIVRRWRSAMPSACRHRRRAEFPIIVRPRGSHAGVGLAKVDDRAATRPLSAGAAGAGILRLALCRLRQ